MAISIMAGSITTRRRRRRTTTGLPLPLGPLVGSLASFNLVAHKYMTLT